jgi:hypothetical protein
VERQAVALKAVPSQSLSELIGADLPPPNTTRWVARMKAQVVCAINDGLLSLHDAFDRYNLTLEELISWQRAIDRDGLEGLRATHAQRYRDLHQQQKRAA